MTERDALADRVGALADAQVLCVGDIMLDRFVQGAVERVSPEAPIPVLRIEHERAMLGGAGNVARNLAALGARTRFLGVVGDDPAGREVARLLALEPGVAADLVVEPTRETGIKTRFMAGTQQLLRTDRETVRPIAEASEGRLLSAFKSALPEAGAVVLSDYGKGTLTRRLLGDAVRLATAAEIPSVVDPKASDYAIYRGATLVTPNRAELSLATRLPARTEEEAVDAARALIAANSFAAVLATRGPDGMILVTEDRAIGIPATAREIYDVSGAGDTVVATVAAALAAGLPLIQAAELANVAAGIVVGKVGTAVAAADEIRSAIGNAERTSEEKIVPLPRALERVEAWRRRGLRIGFTNGCFDLLHPGHVSLLGKARSACDRLIVGLNSDASVARLKGAGRPVQREHERAVLLASLASVDLVVSFAEDTPETLIEAVRPDLLVKGADYRRHEVVGAAYVESYGGRVMLVDLEAGHSTTATLARLAR